MTAPDEGEDLTDDGFLGGRLRILQPRQGYRAAMDAVLLAAAVPAQPGDSVLELGCGVGVASLCLAARVSTLEVTGVERQAAYAALARRNAERNALPLTVVEADLAALPPTLRLRSFDHVIANPPFYPPAAGTQARDRGREAALREDTPLPLWIEVAFRRLRSGGELTLIQSADRLPGMLGALDGRAALTLLPGAARAGREAKRVLLWARKGGRAPFRLLPPLILHASEAHGRDEEDYRPEVRAILRDGKALTMAQ